MRPSRRRIDRKEQKAERCAITDDIGYGVFLEHCEIGRQRFVEDALQTAGRGDKAVATIRLEAFDEGEIFLDKLLPERLRLLRFRC